MTLMNGLVDGRKAYLWTDTAHWSEQTGEVAAYGAKAVTGLFWPFAVAATMNGQRDPQKVLRDIGEAWPQDLGALLAASQLALRQACAPGSVCRLLIAAYEDGPRLFLIASDGAGVAAPFEPVEMGHLTSSGNETKAYRQACERGFTAKRMRWVIDAQLDAPIPGTGALAGAGNRVWIGGKIIEIEVSQSGATQRPLRTVKDRVAVAYG